MKKTSFLLSVMIVISCFCTTYGQTESFEETLFKDTVAIVKRSVIRPSGKDEEIKIVKPEGYPAKDLDTTYTGFRIEIMVADTLLPDSSDLFFRHGNIVVEPLTGNRFAYTIGDFKDEETATGFFNQFVLPNYGKARIVRYQSGKRKD